MNLFSRVGWVLWSTWVHEGWARRVKARFKSSRGQAVMEYFVLFILISIIAAVIYRIAAPLIEGLLVKMANVSIAKNVAGE